MLIDFKSFGGEKIVSRSCKCEREKREAEEQAKLNAEKMQRIEELKSLSLLGKRYENATFSSTLESQNLEFNKAFNRCKKYCKVWENVLKNGQGIYLYGNSGTGKTHITACIANELMKNLIPALFTSLFEISKSVKSTFNKHSIKTEQNLINQFSQIEFLIFDDLGTEIFTKNTEDTWIQGLLYNLVNSRYNANRPTIFTSNYSLKNLVESRGISEKTVDRIYEMTEGACLHIGGESARGKFRRELPF